MGLVINPTAFRIGHVLAWTDAWYAHRIHYPVFVHKSLEIKALLQYILLSKYPTQWSNWIYSHSSYYFSNNKFYITLFVYDGNDLNQYNRSARKHRYGWFRRIRLKRYWTKKQLLDLKWTYQRVFLLCKFIGFPIESLQLDSIRWRFPKRALAKIAGLKEKYGANWVAREELVVWKYLIESVTDNSYSKLGIPILNRLYKLFIRPKILRAIERHKGDSVQYATDIVVSYQKLYFFFSFLDKLMRYVPTYPTGVFNRIPYKLMYRFLRLYFVFVPYWKHVCKFLELVLSYINVGSSFKVYLLDNIHLNAAYISRYIMTCLRRNFDYRDTIIPIKKSLNKLLYARRWRSTDFLKKKAWRIRYARYNNLLKRRLALHHAQGGAVRSLVSRIVYAKKMKYYIKYSGRRLYLKNFRAIRDCILAAKRLRSVENKQLYYKRQLFMSNRKKFLYYRGKDYNKIKLKWYKKGIWLSRYMRKYRKDAKFISFDSQKYKRKFKRKNRIFKLFRTRWIKRKKRYFRRMKKLFMKMKRIRLLKDIIISLSKLSRLNRRYVKSHKDFSIFKKIKFIYKYSFWRIARRKRHVKFYKVQRRRYKRVFGVPRRYRFWLKRHKLRWLHMRRWKYRRRQLFLNRYKNLSKSRIVKPNPIINIPFFFKKRWHPFFFFFFQKNYYFSYINSFIKRKIYFLNLPKNKIYFGNKISLKFFRPYFRISKVVRRGYSNIFFFHILSQNASRFKPFSFPSSTFKEYIKKFDFIPEVEDQRIIIPFKNKGLLESPFLDKFKRLRALEYFGSNSLLYGYKFHFVGRFTRKQKAASLWFSKGANSVSSMKVDVDYGFHTVTLRYSACTLKVWLYRNRGYSFKYGYRMV